MIIESIYAYRPGEESCVSALLSASLSPPSPSRASTARPDPKNSRPSRGAPPRLDRPSPASVGEGVASGAAFAATVSGGTGSSAEGSGEAVLRAAGSSAEGSREAVFGRPVLPRRVQGRRFCGRPVLRPGQVRGVGRRLSYQQLRPLWVELPAVHRDRRFGVAVLHPLRHAASAKRRNPGVPAGAASTLCNQWQIRFTARRDRLGAEVLPRQGGRRRGGRVRCQDRSCRGSGGETRGEALSPFDDG